MAKVRIGVVADDEVGELAALYNWLHRDRELQGLVKRGSRPPGPKELGGVLETITAALGTAAAAFALAERLAAWVQTRRSVVKFTVTTEKGRTIELEADNSADASSLIMRLLRGDDENDA